MATGGAAPETGSETRGVRSGTPKRLIRALLLSLPVLLTTLFLLPFVSPVVSGARWDEFILAFDAQRMLDGQVPYRDFFNFIPPGAFYVLAGLFSFVGRGSLTAARYAGLFVAVLNGALLFAVLDKAGWRRPQAVGMALLYPLALFPFWPVFSHHWLVHAACFAFLLLLPPGGTRPLLQSALLGLLAGLAGMVLQTEGLYLALLGGAAMALACPGREGARRLAAFGLGTAGAIASWLGPLVALGAGREFVRDVILWPGRNYSRPGSDNARLLLEDVPDRLQALWGGAVQPSQGWPHGFVALAGTVLYAALLAAVAALPLLAVWALVRALKRKRAEFPLQLAASLVTVLALGLYLRGRPDWLRTLYLLGFLGPLWLSSWRRSRPEAPGRWGSRPVTLAAWCLVAAAALFHGRWVWVHRPQAWELLDADRPARESPANRFLRVPGRLGPSEAVAAFPEGGEVYLYGASPAVGYTFFTPLSEGYNDLEDHRRAAEQILKTRARWILMTLELEPEYLASASPVAQVIASRYRRAGTLGHVVFYERVREPESPEFTHPIPME
jgi:hypothetical protein